MIITPLEIGSGLVSILFHGSHITLLGSQSVSLLESKVYGLIAGEPEQIHGRAEVDDEECS